MPTPPIPPSPATRPRCDQAAKAALVEAAQQAIARHPELRGVLVVLDYHHGLNEAGFELGQWVADLDPATALPALFGIARQAHRMIEKLQARELECHELVRQQVAVLAHEEVRRVQSAAADGEPQGGEPGPEPAGGP